MSLILPVRVVITRLVNCSYVPFIQLVTIRRCRSSNGLLELNRSALRPLVKASVLRPSLSYRSFMTNLPPTTPIEPTMADGSAKIWSPAEAR
jgi:hypothetical protein